MYIKCCSLLKGKTAYFRKKIFLLLTLLHCYIWESLGWRNWPPQV